MNLTETNWRN